MTNTNYSNAYTKLVKTLDDDQKNLFNEIITHIKDHLDSRTRELCILQADIHILKNRLRVINEAASNHCIEFDSDGNTVASGDIRDSLIKRAMDNKVNIFSELEKG